MSKMKQILELSSPTLKTKTERIVGSVQRCNYCSGNGWFWGQAKLGDTVKIPCPMCEGSGLMHPVVTIEWKSGISQQGNR